MKEKFRQLNDKIDVLSLRERALVMFGVLCVVYLIWDLLLFEPVLSANRATQKSLDAVELQVSTLEKEEKLLARKQSDDSRAALTGAIYP